MLQADSQKSIGGAGTGLVQRGKSLVDRFSHGFEATAQASQPSVWYSGLVIEPADFSGQLARLQLSLQGANAAASSRAAVPVSADTAA